MPISDMPIFSMLRTKMHWHQERQRLLAENVANADTPKFTPHDLVPLNLDQTRAPTGSVTLARTNPGHIGDSSDGGSSQFRQDHKFDFESRPSGNAVGLEDEMLKVASNAMDYQAAAALYTRGLALIKTALGKG